MTPPGLRLTALVLAGLAAAACATTPDRKLAERTSGNVSLLSSQMEGLAVSGRRLAETRAERTARLHAETARVKNDMATDLDLRERTDDRDTRARLDQLRQFADAVTERWTAAAKAGEERRARILGGQAALEAPTKSLGGIASDLAALGEAGDLASRLQFLSGFVGNVTSEVKKRQEATKKAATEAAAASGDKAAKAAGDVGTAGASP
ncbi:MAG TPA: hypothetical protein VFX28_15850 [Methylomirabilota bacterium]|nr:hypothetical protein [Methylomirabilota bacterium]